MNIKAINSVLPAKTCQPIKEVSFARNAEKPEQPLAETPDTDTFTPSEPGTLEQKYDMACLLAAYYKTQYEALAKQGNCNA